MQDTIKVYPWGDFDSFVREACTHNFEIKSHPVLDAVALDLHTGDLQRRDKLGPPTQPWQLPTGAAKSYLVPEEVNARPIMKAWLFSVSRRGQSTGIVIARVKRLWGWSAPGRR